ncbi:hypothetical protein NIES2100_65140 [Calothrix sp. NIES-2100]|uniref:hypothetical protein n=1 Tax=Calothrix sp. NIES-2100 TaxID=1954172 RepID=UPI000B6027F7|nr:hypothetical protein NIES2100_65140 [Calothrix sp. NIES-2100]
MESETPSNSKPKTFDQSNLKHVETEEKNPLPTEATIIEELKPEILPDPDVLTPEEEAELLAKD